MDHPAPHRAAAIAVLLALAVMLAGCASDRPSLQPVRGADPTVERSAHTIEIDGDNRSYLLDTPPGLDEPAALVLMLHGGFGSAEQAANGYGWDEIAGREGVIVAYPDGHGRAWNVGDGCCGRPGATGIDDVAYLEAVVADIAREMPIDPDRVFATGMSNGAMMSYRLACESEIVAAIAPVAGTILGTCDPPAPVSVLHIHGVDDASVRLDGEPGSGAENIDGIPVADSIALWREVGDCGDAVVTTDGLVTRNLASCAEERSVDLVLVAEAGHQWPGAGASGELRARLGFDPHSTALDATEEIWAYFVDHSG